MKASTLIQEKFSLTLSLQQESNHVNEHSLRYYGTERQYDVDSWEFAKETVSLEGNHISLLSIWKKNEPS